MARGYTVATVALALGAPAKWVDNVLSHFVFSSVRQGTQGVARRIGAAGVLELAVVRGLVDNLRIPMEPAVLLARNLILNGEVRAGPDLTLRLDRDRLWSSLERQLEFAIEAAPLPKRGRPRGKTKRGA